uniref:Uncharacterized protein TCIL3000_9_1440 n=1 Tax=Trypanosoma congolense (strain IL3000) TaxID=1068625 RepID=G0UTN3_TRYCI|nr:unnamed protein product [Trypanosoma congolense IL3000]
MVLLTCVCSGGEVYNFVLEVTSTVEELSVLIEVESGIPMDQQVLTTPNGVELCNEKTLKDHNITSDTRIEVRRKQHKREGGDTVDGGRTPHPGMSLREAESRIMELFSAGSEANQHPLSRQAQPVAHETDSSVQDLLYEEIQARNIDENLATALEYVPEAFATVDLLFVDCEINKVKLRALVDCGAQISVVGAKTAELCGLMRLVDKRLSGVVRGVGEEKTLGRVHLTQLNLSGLFIPISLYVLEQQHVDLIIGLDQLRRHCMIVDLKEQCLRVAGVAIPFIPSSELRDDGLQISPQPTSGSAEDTSAAREAPSPVVTEALPVVEGVSGTFTAEAPASSDMSTPQKERAIESLMALTGAEREVVVTLLEAAGWDPDVAMTILMGD